MVYFVIDIGTNSTRLMKAQIEDGQVRAIYKMLRTVRTGEGVHNTGRLSEQAMKRTLDALQEYAEIGKGNPVYCFATSAVRDAENRQAFMEAVKARTGLRIEVLKGEEEAEIGFLGAVGRKGTGVVVDIGGGSTEVIFGREGNITYQHSFPVGCVRGKDVFQGRDFSAEEVSRWARGVLEREGLPNLTGQLAYGIGGTATSLAAIDLKLEEYDGQRVQGYALNRRRIAEIEKELYGTPLAQRRQIAGLEAKRADIILFGVSILGTVMDIAHIDEAMISDRDNLEGFLYKKVLT